MKLQFDIDLVNQMLGYLGTRPYQEVYLLIQSMQDAAKAQAAAPQPTETPSAE